jgi:leucyl/phenylalanyl-tRNA--protein transferase
MSLHAMGRAHSVEVWQDGALVGGVFGITLGGAFFGESMFSARPDASKIALAWLIARLNAGGFRLFDTQFVTEHLESLGAVEMPRRHYRTALQEALKARADFHAMPRDLPPQEVLAHLRTQTS